MKTAPSHSKNGSDAVRLVEIRGGLGGVPGLRMAGVHAGIKKRKTDLALLAFDGPRVCAAIHTMNDIKAAPLLVSAEHIAEDGDAMQALVCNAGCANACTGERGIRDARASARQAAGLLGIRATQVIVASTGVIGVPLPMDRLSKGIERAVKDLDEGTEAGYDAAEAIMTTDHVPKIASYAFYEGEKRYVVAGIAKGSGMINPALATMLSFIATDAPMSSVALRAALSAAAEESFNMICVDGDMSTNDAVYAFAVPGAGDAPAGFTEALTAVCRDLAMAIVSDGEGATKTLTMQVTGAIDVAQARAVAHSIVSSSLVKTAIHGEDPNWGRVVCMAGAARVGVKDGIWAIWLNGVQWVERGAIEVLAEVEAHRLLEGKTVHIRLDLGLGDAHATAWGCDLSSQYVRINAHYRT